MASNHLSIDIRPDLKLDVANLDKHQGANVAMVTGGFVPQSNPAMPEPQIFTIKYGLHPPMYHLAIERDEQDLDWLDSMEVNWLGSTMPLPPPFAHYVFSQLPSFESLSTNPLPVNLGIPSLANFTSLIPMPNFIFPNINLSLPNLDPQAYAQSFINGLEAKAKSFELMVESFMNQLFDTIKLAIPNQANKVINDVMQFITKIMAYIDKLKFDFSFNFLSVLGWIKDLATNCTQHLITVAQKFTEWLPELAINVQVSINQGVTWLVNKIETITGTITQAAKDALDKLFKLLFTIWGVSNQFVHDLLNSFNQFIQNVESALESIIQEQIDKFSSYISGLIKVPNLLIPALPQIGLPPLPLVFPDTTPFTPPNVRWSDWLKPAGLAIIPTTLTGADPALALSALPTSQPNLIAVFSKPGDNYVGAVRIKAKPGTEPGPKSVKLRITGSDPSNVTRTTLGTIEATVHVVTDEQWATQNPNAANPSINGSMSWSVNLNNPGPYSLMPGLVPTKVTAVGGLMEKPVSTKRGATLIDKIKPENITLQLLTYPGIVIKQTKDTKGKVLESPIIYYSSVDFTLVPGIDTSEKTLSVPSVNMPNIILPSGISIPVSNPLDTFISNPPPFSIPSPYISVVWVDGKGPEEDAEYEIVQRYFANLDQADLDKIVITQDNKLDFSNVSTVLYDTALVTFDFEISKLNTVVPDNPLFSNNTSDTPWIDLKISPVEWTELITYYDLISDEFTDDVIV